MVTNMSKFKQKLTLLMAITFIFTVMLACSDDKPRIDKHPQMITLADTLSFGYWELVAVSGGFIGWNWAEPALVGISPMKIFISKQNENLSFDYEWHHSDTLWEKGIITLIDTVPNEYGHRILSMGKECSEYDWLYRYEFHTKENQLFMDLDANVIACDAFIYHFRKIILWL